MCTESPCDGTMLVLLLLLSLVCRTVAKLYFGLESHICMCKCDKYNNIYDITKTFIITLIFMII